MVSFIICSLQMYCRSFGFISLNPEDSFEVVLIGTEPYD